MKNVVMKSKVKLVWRNVFEVIMRKRQLTKNEDIIVRGKYFTSIYKCWADGKFRSKHLYNTEGKLLNVFEYTYENEEDYNGRCF